MREIKAFPNKTVSSSSELGHLDGLLLGSPEQLAKPDTILDKQYSGFGSVIEVGSIGPLQFHPPPVTILLRGLTKFADLEHCSARLALLEARNFLPERTILLLAAVGDTPSSVALLASGWPALPRLNGLVFIADRLLENFSLPRALPFDAWPDPVRLARSLTVLKAKELNIPALIWKNEMDFDQEYDHRAERDGFSGIVAGTHP
jgi:citrate lyase beta subunit